MLKLVTFVAPTAASKRKLLPAAVVFTPAGRNGTSESTLNTSTGRTIGWKITRPSVVNVIARQAGTLVIPADSEAAEIDKPAADTQTSVRAQD